MRVAVISDVHSNLHALEAVLAEVDAGGFDELWCLGDVVGYGPRPNECAALVRERAALCLAGNHDLVVLGKISMSALRRRAGVAAAGRAACSTDDARTFLETLEPLATRPGAELFHGSPRDPVWDYVLSEDAARQSFAATSEPLVLVGHSHVALELVERRARGSHGGIAAAGHESTSAVRAGCSTPARSASRATATRAPPGSRLTRTPGWATFRRTDYPVERTQAEMREQGLPEILAERLAHGV